MVFIILIFPFSAMHTKFVPPFWSYLGQSILVECIRHTNQMVIANKIMCIVKAIAQRIKVHSRWSLGLRWTEKG